MIEDEQELASTANRKHYLRHNLITFINAFDKHRKNVTAWCEECDQVFDALWAANSHQNEKGHKIKVTEFWITGRR